MHESEFPYKLYLVVSEDKCKLNLLDVVKEAILGGVDIVQLREKFLSQDDYITKAVQVKAITDRYNVPLIINDNLEVAKRVSAFGVHVGQSDLPPSIICKTWKDCRNIGYSIECLQQLQTKEAMLADYFAVSPVFKTPTKFDTIIEWGLDGIKRIRKLTNKPLIAIGGMNINNIKEAMNSGADCIAIVSAICAADNPGEIANKLKREIITYDKKI